MIVIEGTVRIPPENLEAARPVMEQMIRASRAEAGCIDKAYAFDVLDPGHGTLEKPERADGAFQSGAHGGLMILLPATRHHGPGAAPP